MAVGAGRAGCGQGCKTEGRCIARYLVGVLAGGAPRTSLATLGPSFGSWQQNKGIALFCRAPAFYFHFIFYFFVSVRHFPS